MGHHILIISPEPWSGHSVSKHHFAMELAKRGHEVVFYGPPEDVPFQLEPVACPEGAVKVLHAPRVARGLRFFPPRLRRNFEAYWLQRVEAMVGEKFHLIWLFENSRFFDMRFAGNRLKVYHQVDLNQNFEPEIAARTADHVFCTSEPIRECLSAYRYDVIKIHHGVQSGAFDPSTEDGFFSKTQVNCVYAGNMSMEYLDRDLILRCVEAYPDLLFHFFGGFKKEDPFQSRLAEYGNTLIHGKVDASRMLPILSNADILMVTYQRAHFRDQANPHKMMEYMMSGRVTVATYTSEYGCVRDLLAMCPPEGDYVELLGRVIQDIKAWNAPEQVAKRKAFAADNTYSRQLDRIAEALGPKGYLIS